MFNWPDFGADTKYIIPPNPREDMREQFNLMVRLVRDLTSDIGYSDMLLQFDDDQKLAEAQARLTDAGLEWKIRD